MTKTNPPRWLVLVLGVVLVVATSVTTLVVRNAVQGNGPVQVAAAGKSLQTSTKVDKTFLSVITAGALSSVSTGEKTQRVSLTHVAQSGTWFTDRPYRETGVDTTDNILQKFFDRFPSDPPNVSVSLMTPEGMKTIVTELSDPQWDQKTLEFTSTMLEGDGAQLLPTSAENVSITIDITSQACQIEFTDLGGVVTGIEHSTQYGDYESTGYEGPGGDSYVNWSGSWDMGCGGSATALTSCANGLAITVDIQNPEIGTNTTGATGAPPVNESSIFYVTLDNGSAYGVAYVFEGGGVACLQ